MTTTEIADDVLLIEMPMSSMLATRAVALRGETTTLIDAGTRAHASMIVEKLTESGFSPIGDIYCTHFHHDHTGGLSVLAAAGSTRVHAHVAEVAAISRPETYADALEMSCVTPAIPVADGFPDVVGILDGHRAVDGASPWFVVHVPGHTWGHIALWRPADRLLIAGDVIQGRGVPSRGVPGEGTGIPYYVDVSAYQRSLDRLLGLQPRRVVVAHENPAWSGVVLDAEQAHAAVQASLAEVERIDDLVAKAVAAGRETVREVTADVCRDSGSLVTPQAQMTVRAHLATASSCGSVNDARMRVLLRSA